MSFIESNGIRILEETLQSNNSIVSYATKNDKSPIWDGHIIIYKYHNERNRILKNEDIIGQFLIQVKTHEVREFSNRISISRIEMENFAKTIGTIYYNIELKGEDYRIYYYRILNSDAKRILKKMGTKKHKTLEFDLLPKNSPKKVYDIHKDFYRDITRQSIQNPIYNIDDILKNNKNPKFEFDLPSDVNVNNILSVYEALVENKPYLYLNNGETRIPVTRLFDEVTVMPFESITNKCLFSSMDEEITISRIITPNELMEISFENIVSLIRNTDKDKKSPEYLHAFQLKVKEVRNLELLIKSLKIRKCLLQGDSFSIIGSDINNIKIFDEKELQNIQTELQKINSKLIFYSKLKDILLFYHLDTNINVKKITQQDAANIELVYNAIIKGKKVKEGLDNTICQLNFLNYYFMLYCQKVDDNMYKFYDAFKNDVISVGIGDGFEKSSRYFLLSASYPNEKGLIKFCNYNICELVDDILKHKSNSKAYCEHAQNIALQLIEIYDKSKKDYILEASTKILLSIDNEEFRNVTFLNQIQIKIRNGCNLCKEDIERLILMKNEYASDYFMLCGINLCLKDYVEYEFYFNKLLPQQQEIFKLYPIYQLFIK